MRLPSVAVPAVPGNPSSPPAIKRRGNPNLAFIPRCGARTRAGCPCRGPSLHGKLRCRMHGGRSTGPRTEDGMARLRAARTTHGNFSAETRAFNRQHVSFMRRGRIWQFGVLHHDRLPPELAARMDLMAPELRLPPLPTCGISRAEDRALLQAETAALAPWTQAIALARQARRADRAVPSGAVAADRATKVLAPDGATGTIAPTSAASPSAAVTGPPEPHAPIPPPPARPAPQPAAVSAGGEPPTALAATEHAPHGVRAPAHVAGQQRPHAPIPPAPTRPAPQPASASAGAEPPATLAAPERNAHGKRGARLPAHVATLPEAHAPIRASHGARIGAAPTGLAGQASAHAPEQASMRDRGGRAVPAGRAARRWLRQQKLMHGKRSKDDRS